MVLKKERSKKAFGTRASVNLIMCKEQSKICFKLGKEKRVSLMSETRLRQLIK